MPYTPYLTAIDRAIDRDTNEMLSPRPNASGAGFIAQGYANMDVLPEQMALADMLQRRQALSMNSRQGRREQAQEDSLMADQEQFDGYSNFVRGTAGMNETDRAAAMRDRALNNPSELSNPMIGKANTAIYLNDRATLDAKENVLKSKRADYEMRGLAYDDANFERAADLKDQEFKNAREQADLNQKQLERSNYNFENDDLSKVGEHIFNLNPFGDDKDTRDSMIKTVAYLPKETKEDRDNIRALSSIAEGLVVGRDVVKLKSYLDIQNRDFLRTAYKQTGGIDLSNLPKDRAKRDELVLRAHDLIAKNGGDLVSFGSYIDKVKSYNDSEDAVNQLTEQFTGSIKKLEELSKNPDPLKKQELIGELALIKSRAAGQAGHFQKEYNDFKATQDLRDKESEISKRNSDALEKVRNGSRMDRRLGLSVLVEGYKQKRASQKEGFDYMKEAADVRDKGLEEGFGLEVGATIPQIMEAMKKYVPPVGAGSADNDLDP